MKRIGPRTEPCRMPEVTHCLGSGAVEPGELSADCEVGLNPFNDSSCDAVFVFEPIEQDLVVDRVERGA